MYRNTNTNGINNIGLKSSLNFIFTNNLPSSNMVNIRSYDSYSVPNNKVPSSQNKICSVSYILPNEKKH